MGMQHYVLRTGEPRGLPLNEKLLPEYLKEVGYKTHIIGKWHLGFAKKSFIPTNRAPHAANDDDPLQTTSEDIEKMQHIQDPKRKAYAAMVRALDRSIGRVIRVLEEKEMLKNTVILFFSDNGGPTLGLYNNRASNYPLRG
uniref:Sulfatase N-terminal domain-containing protein n=1 Tax=Phlebotomus papatasi TaxID=29031 RepID=A0A1B0DHL1_PHLPP